MENLPGRVGAVVCVAMAAWWSCYQVWAAVWFGPGIALLTLVPLTALAYADRLWGSTRFSRRFMWSATGLVVVATVVVGTIHQVPYADW